MRAAVLYERNQPMVVETVDLAAPAAGEVTVRLAGAARVIAVDLLDSKLERATAFGATHTSNAGRAQAHKVIRSLTSGRGADYAFEVVGNPQVATTAFLSTAKGGALQSGEAVRPLLVFD